MAAVPKIEGLTVENMLELAKTSPNALKHLPDERDWDGLNRKWVADILFLVQRAKFEKIFKDALKASKDTLGEEQPVWRDATRVRSGFSELHELLT